MVELTDFPFVKTQRDVRIIWTPAVDQRDQLIRAELSFRHCQ